MAKNIYEKEGFKRSFILIGIFYTIPCIFNLLADYVICDEKLYPYDVISIYNRKNLPFYYVVIGIN